MTIQERLQMVMKMHNLNASSFAERIGVQRSNVSHILSGRNNPSLDFIQKTLKAFPRVNGDWLVSGRKVTHPSPSLDVIEHPETNEATRIQEGLKEEVNQSTALKNKVIERIVVFYSDGTFEETAPKNKS